MSNVLLNDQSRLVADRVDATEVGLDPLTILTVITQVLPMLIKCFNRNDEPNAPLAAASFRRYHSSHPVALRNRTMRRVRAESDENLTKAQAYSLADAVIAQALATGESTAMACCMEAGT